MKIGFIDHHLNNYHADVFHKILNGPAGGGKVEIAAAYETHPRGEDWCAAKQVKRMASPEEVVKESDAIIVLAPDNIETHVELSRAAIESKKPVYIDKNLARSQGDAHAIAALAARNGTPLMSASALRFAVELEDMLRQAGGPIESVFARGFGKWRGYSIHTIAPALRLFGWNVKRLIDTGTGSTRFVTLDDGSRRATIEVRESENQDQATPWQFGILVGNRYEVCAISQFEAFYVNLLKEVVEFCATGKSPISIEEQLMVVTVESAADESLAQDNAWITVG
ncbi:MAG: Gfo/Idh/MocA family oxidoreductase [bacterium]|nr:Gfo/Idh/MocA family oxidoreductase [Candidatus Sumerlaeota bacterium]